MLPRRSPQLPQVGTSSYGVTFGEDSGEEERLNFIAHLPVLSTGNQENRIPSNKNADINSEKKWVTRSRYNTEIRNQKQKVEDTSALLVMET